MDYSIIRESLINVNNFVNGEELNFDSKYLFYYDETYNVRKLKINEKNLLNFSKDENFILAGITLEHVSQKLRFSNEFLKLTRDLKLEPTSELKIKTLKTSGSDFLSLMNSKRMEHFLNFLLDIGVFVHYDILDCYFFSIVDIIDSLMGVENLNFKEINVLKTTLYIVAYENSSSFISMASSYGYPNIKKENVAPFIDALLDLVALSRDSNKGHNLPDYVAYDVLMYFLINSRDLPELVFLDDNPEKILFDSFFLIYTQPIYAFKNSYHYFDEEVTIEKKLKEDKINLNGNELTNYEFLNHSEDNPFIQTSDVVTGLMGRLTKFFNNTKFTELEKQLTKATKLQRKNIEHFQEILNTSFKKNRTFRRTSTNLDLISKLDFFLSYKFED